MAAQTPSKDDLYDWLGGAIDELPPTGQIILNFDGDTVKWEIKAIFESRDRNGDHQRTEIRRFGRLLIGRRTTA